MFSERNNIKTFQQQTHEEHTNQMNMRLTVFFETLWRIINKNKLEYKEKIKSCEIYFFYAQITHFFISIVNIE